MYLFEHWLRNPADIIVTEHATFRVSCRSTGVNECAALARLLAQSFLNNNLVFDIFAKFQEIIPKVNSTVLDVGIDFFFSPKNKGLNSW